MQLSRAGVGAALIDPIACPDLGGLGQALEGVEWVLHAASQDLPCLADVGMRPTRLFDTELASRLLGLPRVGLAASCEQILGVSLAKGHGAADWSRRPLPHDWLRYAALDVELLVDLRAGLAQRLADVGKLDWAVQEFAAIVAAPPARPPAEPWRRTSGVHRLRSPRQLAIVRSLWEARENMARRRDIAPGRMLPDRVIVEIATLGPESRADLAALKDLTGPRARRLVDTWWHAVRRAQRLGSDALPERLAAVDGPPPPSRWAERDPAAARRLAAARAALSELASRLEVPLENVLSPGSVRALMWSPPPPADRAAIANRLAVLGARRWQIELTAGALAAAADAGDALA